MPALNNAQTVAVLRAVAVTARPNDPPLLPSRRTDLGCTGVAKGLSGGLAEGSQGTIYLQIAGGPQGSRTPDLRRANPDYFTPLSHTGPHPTPDLQGFLARLTTSGRRAPKATALSLFVNGLSERRSTG